MQGRPTHVARGTGDRRMTGKHEPIAIVGCGDHARVVADILRSSDRVAAGCIELRPPDGDCGSTDLRCLGDLTEPMRWASSIRHFVVGIGANHLRAEAFARCLSLGLEPVRAIHRYALLLSGASVDPGSQICAGAIIGVGARVRGDAIVNTGASVDHDCVVGMHSTVAPGARLAGRVTIGEGVHVGIGATVREGLAIGDRAFVAAGAVVIRDVAAGERVAGVPARPLRSG